MFIQFTVVFFQLCNVQHQARKKGYTENLFLFDKENHILSKTFSNLQYVYLGVMLNVNSSALNVDIRYKLTPSEK